MTGKPDDLIAFIDESKRPIRNRRTGKADTTQWHYVLAAVVAMQADVDAIRRKLHGIEADLNYQLHYYEMKSHTRRKNAVDAIGEIADWEGYISETTKPIKPSGDKEHSTRDILLQHLFLHLHEIGVRRALLETRVKPNAKHKTLDRKDLAILKKMRDRKMIDPRFRLDHVGKHESMLKIADLLAGSRTDMLCVSDQAVYPRITHRAGIIKPE